MRVLEALEQARYQAEVLGNRVLARALLDAARADADAEERFHLRRLGDWLESRGDWLAARGDRLDGAPGVFLLLVDGDRSAEAFVARCALAPFDAPGPGPDCGPAFVRAVDRAARAVLRLLAARRQLRPRTALLAGQRLLVEGPPAAHWVKDGASVGLAAALLFAASWTGRALEGELACTGEVAPDGAILSVGAVEAKVRAALRERPGLRRVLVPSGAPAIDDARVRPVATLAEALELALGLETLAAGAPALLDVEGAVRLGVELYEKTLRFDAAAEVLGAALEAIAERRRLEGDPRLLRVEEFLALWRSGSALVHAGDPEGALVRLERARALGEELWSARELDPRAYLGFRGNLAVLLRDLYAYGAAEAVIVETLALQRELRQDRRELAKTLGNLGELYTFTGQHAQAEQALLEALESLRAVYPEEVPRELCYLGNLELARGRPERALGRYEEGLRANRGVEYGRALNEGFLRYGEARALLALGRAEEAERSAGRGLAALERTAAHPGPLLCKVRGLARIGCGKVDEGRADLRAAADLTWAAGALARFAAATALAELALHLLASGAPAEIDEGRAAAREVARIAAAVPGLPDGDLVCAAIEEAAAGTDRVAVAGGLRRLLARFRY